MNRVRARLTRIRQPPEKADSGRSRSPWSKPSPTSSWAARAGAL